MKNKGNAYLCIDSKLLSSVFGDGNLCSAAIVKRKISYAKLENIGTEV